MGLWQNFCVEVKLERVRLFLRDYEHPQSLPAKEKVAGELLMPSVFWHTKKSDGTVVLQTHLQERRASPVTRPTTNPRRPSTFLWLRDVVEQGGARGIWHHYVRMHCRRADDDCDTYTHT